MSRRGADDHLVRSNPDGCLDHNRDRFHVDDENGDDRRDAFPSHVLRPHLSLTLTEPVPPEICDGGVEGRGRIPSRSSTSCGGLSYVSMHR